MKKLISVLLVVVMCFALTCTVFADDETAAEAADAAAEAEETVEEAAAEAADAAEEVVEAAEEVTSASSTGVSDASNIIGIIVAVIIGVGAIVAIVLLAPKKNTVKKK